MTMNSSGPISLGGSVVGQSISLELGQPAIATISLGGSARSLAQVPTGQIQMPTNFYGKSIQFLVEYLLVGGGGGGGGHYGGGAGAGGYLTGNASLSLSTTYSIIVGNGGTGGPDLSNASGTQGGNTSFNNITAIGGGFGSGGFGGTIRGGNGGSGGAAGQGASAGGNCGGSGTAGQGNNGGFAGNNGSRSGSGGGAGQAGTSNDSSAQNANKGGDGLQSSINGVATYYAGGGGGGVYTSANNAGGLGGGGSAIGSAGGAGVNNLGGGGGGGVSGGQGGSGVAIIAYQGSQKYIGGIVDTTTRAGWTVHKFNSSGDLAPRVLNISYLLVGGGGGGSSYRAGGGGGGGQVVGGNAQITNLELSYPIVVGNGGAAEVDGGSSSFYGVTAIGGIKMSGGFNGAPAGTYVGGIGYYHDDPPANLSFSTGGGGASWAGNGGNAGEHGTPQVGGGIGANGPTSDITGTLTYYAGGGGGATSYSVSILDPTGPGTRKGGLGGGGDGEWASHVTAVPAVANTGGGGAAGNAALGYGGSGIVIIKYEGAPIYTGGNVTQVGGFTIHQFLASGTLTPI